MVSSSHCQQGKKTAPCSSTQGKSVAHHPQNGTHASFYPRWHQKCVFLSMHSCTDHVHNQPIASSFNKNAEHRQSVSNLLQQNTTSVPSSDLKCCNIIIYSAEGGQEYQVCTHCPEWAFTHTGTHTNMDTGAFNSWFMKWRCSFWCIILEKKQNSTSLKSPTTASASQCKPVPCHKMTPKKLRELHVMVWWVDETV